MSGLQILTCHPCDKHQYNTEGKKKMIVALKRESLKKIERLDKIVA